MPTLLNSDLCAYCQKYPHTTEYKLVDGGKIQATYRLCQNCKNKLTAADKREQALYESAYELIDPDAWADREDERLDAT